MSGPEFEEVLRAHHLSGGGRNLGQWRTEWTCACGSSFVTDGHMGESVKGGNDAHLSAALHAEVARWLGDEGTREVVARRVAEIPLLHLGWAANSDDIATAALAALTTTDQEEIR